MEFGILLREYNFNIKLENCFIKIINGNWGVFRQSFTKHMHSYYELHYVTGGQGTLITDTFQIPLRKGCFYLLPPRTNHEQWSNQLDFLEEYHLAFEITSNSDKDLVWRHLISKGYYSMQQQELEVFFDNISKEASSQHYGYQDMVYQNIQAIFITLIRSIVKNDKMSSAPTNSLDDRRILLIDEAFIYEYQSITLPTMSNQLNLSIRQTQRFIQDKYGVSFSILKYRSRLSHAAMLLSTTKLSLDEISNQVGYNSYSFFCRTFKKHYYLTPADYRKSHYHE